MWYDAATQVMYTYGLAIGAMIALGSYNQPNHNYVRDCCTIAVLNTSASILGGFGVFAILGFMAKAEVILMSENSPSLSGISKMTTKLV